MIHRMSFDDFKRNFTNIEICNITLDQFDVDQSSKLHIYNRQHKVPCSSYVNNNGIMQLYKAYQQIREVLSQTLNII